MKKQPPTRILLIDDEKNFRRVTSLSLKEAGFDVRAAGNGAEGLRALEEEEPEVILCDLNMPVMDGMDFLSELRKRNSGIPVIILTAYASIESAVKAMRAGAFNYLTKPINRAEMELAIQRAAEFSRLSRENRMLREITEGRREVDRLIGDSAVMRELRETISRLALSDAPVLISGESGTGKELIARALHFDGPRAEGGAFVVLNCAAVPGELLESLLFGHRKGAFTGADADHEGKFEAADGGTLFLDEIGDMPLGLQAKLLRALQEGEIERLGDSRPRPVDVRIISATHQDLAVKIEEGAFRQDLYYRLAVIPIEAPPLRDHLEDTPLLVRHFLQRHGSGDILVKEESLAELKTRSWPGNVRELENLIMRVCALNPGISSIGADLPGMQPEAAGPTMARNIDFGAIELPENGLVFEDLERSLLEAAWEKSGHNQSRGAGLLGLPRQAFSYRLQKFGIIPKHGRSRDDEG